MEKIKENVMCLIITIVFVAIGVTFYFVYSNNSEDYTYMRLSAENNRVRESVEIYYLTEDEKKNIYNELDNIDKLIVSKGGQIEIFNKIENINKQLMIYEKNNINADI